MLRPPGRVPRRRFGFSALACAAVLTLGCVATPRATITSSSPKIDPARIAEARELRESRRAWCGYLQELYRRADGAGDWPELDACMRTPTTGSAEVTKVAADCSMKVLESFAGDPLTPEYAHRAGLCGSEAIQRSSADSAEVATLTSAICEHVNACGVSARSCELRIQIELGPQLSRVLGALNRPARRALSRCVAHTSCGDVADDITSCLEPLMDRLLYSSNVAPPDTGATPVAKR